MAALSLAAQFTHEHDAQDAYTALTFYEADHLTKHALSTFRLYSALHWYVVVVGEVEGVEPFVPLVRYLTKRGRIVPIADETIDGLMAKRR